MSTLFQAQKISKSYGLKTLFDAAQFSVNQREHIGVIGANGAGKSTLFKCLAQHEPLDSGEFVYRQGLKLGYLAQDSQEELHGPVNDLLEACETPIWEVKRLGHGLGLDENHYAQEIDELSGGFRMRVKLLSLLADQPDLLLLDEPTNYLDLESLVVLENFLINYKKAFLLISHDREFLKRTTDHTLEIENGQATKFPGHIEDYFEQKRLLREHLEKTASSMQKKRGEILKFVTRFGAKASHARQAQSRLKRLDKMPQIEISTLPINVSLPIPPPVRTGKMALETHHLQLGYGQSVIIQPVSLALQRGDHVGIVGVNGAGKSTLLKGLAGELRPQSGEVKTGLYATLGYYAQHVSEALSSEATVYDELVFAAHKDVTVQEIKDMAGSFLFSGDDIHKKIAVLSGGEKARVALAQILLKKCPVLLLDEPTNHLDFHTVEALTHALTQFAGTVITVSHDRSFIRRIAKKIIEIRDHRVEVYPGSYEEYLWSLQRGSWAAKSAAPSATSKSPAKTSPSARKANFKANFKAQRKNLERSQRKLQQELADIESELKHSKDLVQETNQKLITTNGPEVGGLLNQLSEAQTRVEQLENQWFKKQETLEDTARQLAELVSAPTGG